MTFWSVLLFSLFIQCLDNKLIHAVQQRLVINIQQCSKIGEFLGAVQTLVHQMPRMPSAAREEESESETQTERRGRPSTIEVSKVLADEIGCRAAFSCAGLSSVAIASSISKSLHSWITMDAASRMDGSGLHHQP